jgi:predicted MFS family arabinose efflux permease
VSSNKPIYVRLLAANLFLFFGFNIWQSLFNNFAVEELAVRADQIGLIQSVREVPGLLSLWLTVLAVVFSEMQILSLSTVVLGLGLILTAYAHSWAALIVGTMVMSIGFHAFYPFSSAIALKITEGRATPRLLGILQAVGALAAVAATLTILLGLKTWGYRNLFIIAGVVTIVSGLAIWRRERMGNGRRRQRIVLRRRYWLYYVLTFLMGCRRHMFTTFAIFLLVQRYGLPAQRTALLLLVNSLLGMLLFRYLGEVVGRVGERLSLTVTFVLLVGIFMGYAFVNNLWALIGLYMLDNLLFGPGLAVESYFKKIAIGPDEVTSNMTIAQTVNHIAAIFVPTVGGIIWQSRGPAVTFIFGAVIALISLAFTQFMRTPSVETTPQYVSTA